MKNTYAVFLYGNEYTCSQFFDTDKGSGIDIKDAMTQKHIGEMFGETIPEPDASIEETIDFELRVETFIDENI